MEDLDNKGGQPRRRTLDLSLAQVAASALATVVGAVLASQLGVYGTILGAAVVSVGATTGTAVFQHVFRRTGEQLREMTATPVAVEQPRPVEAVPARAETQVFDPFDPGGERTRMMARINPPEQGEAVAVYRGRTGLKPRSWRVYGVTAVLVFALAMATVGVIELASGKPASHLFDSGGGRGTSGAGASAPADPSPGGSVGRSDTKGADTNGTPGEGGASPNPSTSASPRPSGSTGRPSPADTTPSPQGSTGTGAGNSGSSESSSSNAGSGNARSGSGTAAGTSGGAAAPQSLSSP